MKKFLLLSALISTLSYASISVAIMPGAGHAQMQNNMQQMQQNKELHRLHQHRRHHHKHNYQNYQYKPQQYQ